MNKLSLLWTYIKAELKDIWNRSKMYIIGAVALLIALEWRQLKEWLLVKAGEKNIKSSQKQDQTLATEENTDNSKADALVAEATELSNTDTTVDDDWNKK